MNDVFGYLSGIFLLTRLSRGVTCKTLDKVREKYGFLLTRLSRGVTSDEIFDRLSFKISTHTPLARRDRWNREKIRQAANFYSHASREA